MEDYEEFNLIDEIQRGKERILNMFEESCGAWGLNEEDCNIAKGAVQVLSDMREEAVKSVSEIAADATFEEERVWDLDQKRMIYDAYDKVINSYVDNVVETIAEAKQCNLKRALGYLMDLSESEDRLGDRAADGITKVLNKYCGCKVE